MGMKILNLYAGIGGNRKLWGDEHEITAVEYMPDIAKVYQDHFPKDKVIITDAHDYLLKHFMEYDFIWASPPCPTHSKVRIIATYKKDSDEIRQEPVFPDMKLYEEIIFLQYYFRGLWCVENVIGFYEPLIKPYQLADHYFWANFFIPDYETGQSREHCGTIETLEERKGFKLDSYKVDKRKLLRNCVEPEVGKHILHYALHPYEPTLKLL